MEKRNTFLQGLTKLLEPIYNPVAGTVEQVRQAASPAGYKPKSISDDEWDQYVQNPLGKNIQNVASIGSLFLPLGGTTLLGTIARGAAAGAAQGFGGSDLRKPDTVLPSVLTGGALGGVTAGVLGGAGKLYSKYASKGAKAVQEATMPTATELVHTPIETPVPQLPSERVQLVRPATGVVPEAPLPIRASAGTPSASADEFALSLLKDFPSTSKVNLTGIPKAPNPSELGYLSDVAPEVKPGSGALPIPKTEPVFTPSSKVAAVNPTEIVSRNPTQAEIIKGKLFAGEAAKTGSPQALESARASVVKQFEDAGMAYNTAEQRAKGITDLLAQKSPEARAALEGTTFETKSIVDQLKRIYRDAPKLLQKYGKEVTNKLERAGAEIDGTLLHDLRTFVDESIPDSAFGPSTTGIADKTRVMSDIRDVLSNSLKSHPNVGKYSQLLDDESALLTLRKAANKAFDKGNKITLIPGTNAKVDVAPITNRLSAAVTKGRAAASGGGLKLPSMPMIPNTPTLNIGARIPAAVGSNNEQIANNTGATLPTGSSAGQPSAISQADINAVLDDMLKHGVSLKDATAYIKASGAGADSGVPNTEAAIKDRVNAKSGLQHVDDMEQFLKADPNVLVSAKLPNALQSPTARKFNVAAREAYDVLTRTRTGAALNMNEQQFYQSYVPQLFDDEGTMDYKYTLLRNLYNGIINGG